jgi:hypothetical protein
MTYEAKEVEHTVTGDAFYFHGLAESYKCAMNESKPRIFEDFEREWAKLTDEDRLKYFFHGDDDENFSVKSVKAGNNFTKLEEDMKQVRALNQKKSKRARASERAAAEEPQKVALQKALLKTVDTSQFVEQGPKEKLPQTYMLEEAIKELLRATNMPEYPDNIAVSYKVCGNDPSKVDTILECTDPAKGQVFCINLSELMRCKPDWAQCVYDAKDQENYLAFLKNPRALHGLHNSQRLREDERKSSQSHLTLAEELAIRIYTGAAFKAINSVLSMGEDLKSYKQHISHAYGISECLLHTAVAMPAIQRSIDLTKYKLYVAPSLQALQDHLRDRPEDFAYFSIVLVNLPEEEKSCSESMDKRAIVAVHNGKIIRNGLESDSLVIDIADLCNNPNNTFLSKNQDQEKLKNILNFDSGFRHCEMDDSLQLLLLAEIELCLGKIFDTYETVLKGKKGDPALTEELNKIRSGMERNGFHIAAVKGFFSTTTDPAVALKFGGAITYEITRPTDGMGLHINQIAERPYEKEVLFPHGQEFFYFNVEEGPCARVMAIPVRTLGDEDRMPAESRDRITFFADKKQDPATASTASQSKATLL